MTVRDVTPEWLATHRAYLLDPWCIGRRIVAVEHDVTGARYLRAEGGEIMPEKEIGPELEFTVLA